MRCYCLRNGEKNTQQCSTSGNTAVDGTAILGRIIGQEPKAHGQCIMRKMTPKVNGVEHGLEPIKIHTPKNMICKICSMLQMQVLHDKEWRLTLTQLWWQKAFCCFAKIATFNWETAFFTLKLKEVQSPWESNRTKKWKRLPWRHHFNWIHQW